MQPRHCLPFALAALFALGAWVLWPESANVGIQETEIAANLEPWLDAADPESDRATTSNEPSQASETAAIRLAVDRTPQILVEPDQVGFFGRVNASEIPFESLRVRLNIFDIDRSRLDHFSVQDPSTWNRLQAPERSAPKPLHADGSFVLLGRPPPPSTDRARRYVVEICVAPDELGGKDLLAWPTVGRSSLLAVSVDWGKDATLGEWHGPVGLEVSPPHRLSITLTDHHESAWFHDLLHLHLKVVTGNGSHAISNPRSFLSGDRPTELLLGSTAGPRTVQALLDFDRSSQFQRVKGLTEILVDGQMTVALDPPECGYALLQLDGPLYLDAESAKNWPPRLRIHSPLHDSPESISSIGLSSSWVAEMPAPIDLDSKHRVARVTEAMNHFKDNQGKVWISLGWLQAGRYSVEVSQTQDGRNWGTKTLDVQPYQVTTGFAPLLAWNGLARISLDAQVPARVLGDLHVYNAQGDLDFLSEAEYEGKREISRVLSPEARLLLGQHRLSSNHFVFYSAPILPPAGRAREIRLKKGPSTQRFRLQDHGLSSGWAYLSVRNEEMKWVSLAGAHDYDRSLDAPELVLEGLPAGDYQANFHDRVRRGTPPQLSIEFSVH